MRYRLVTLTAEHLDEVAIFSDEIYKEHNNKYPAFSTSNSVDNKDTRKDFIKLFLLPSTFVNYNIRQAYALVDDDGFYHIIVGIARFSNMPTWSLSWILSKGTGAQFIVLFRALITELIAIHEGLGLNEFFVSYPADREQLYSRILFFLRKRYYTFVETTVKKHTFSQYSQINQLIGLQLPKYDTNIRRYILKREQNIKETIQEHASTD